MALVFIHAGYSPYLEFSLRQAAAASPASDIVLLGDASNDRFPFVRHVDTGAGAYRQAGDAFSAVYRHLSMTAHGTVERWYLRWFWLQTYVHETGLAEALVLDSDVMLFAPESEVRARVGGAPCALSRPALEEPFAWAASPHASFWTAAALDDFCAFVQRSYAEPFAPYDDKWRHHVANGVDGGVCDMTALYLWAEGQPGLANLAEAQGGTAFDHNLNVPDNAVPDEYRMDGRFKALAWAGGQPVGDNRVLGAPVRFYGLHCQGHAKGQMPGLYSGPAFNGQAAARRAVVTENGLRRQASALVQPLRKLKSRLGL